MRRYSREIRFAVVWVFALSVFLDSRAAQLSLYPTDAMSSFPTSPELERIETNLLYYCVFSPDWRVSEDRGAKVADARSPAVFLRTLAHRELSQSVTARIRIRFSPYVFGNAAWATEEHRSLFELGKGAPKESGVKVWEENGICRSSLVIGASGLWFEIDEFSPRIAREPTDAAIKALGALVHRVQKFGGISEIRTQFAHFSRDELTITPSGDRGRYQVSGYVNPQEEGVILLRVYKKDGQEMPGQDSHRTLEYVGWSSDVMMRFYFSSELVINGEGPDETARIEVVFQPRSERRLFGVETSVSKWTR